MQAEKSVCGEAVPHKLRGRKAGCAAQAACALSVLQKIGMFPKQ
ncbi:hypothetical protein [Kingella potus]|nr:hypothetical protein [Kingella potus]